jgi:hypothetical protein
VFEVLGWGAITLLLLGYAYRSAHYGLSTLRSQDRVCEDFVLESFLKGKLVSQTQDGYQANCLWTAVKAIAPECGYNSRRAQHRLYSKLKSRLPAERLQRIERGRRVRAASYTINGRALAAGLTVDA